MRKAVNETKTVVIEMVPKEAPLQRSVLHVHVSTAGKRMKIQNTSNSGYRREEMNRKHWSFLTFFCVFSYLLGQIKSNCMY